MRDQILLLKQIQQNKYAKKLIEDFLQSYHGSVPCFSSFKAKHRYYNNILAKLTNLAISLERHNGIKAKATLLYFSLDKELFSLIPSEFTKDHCIDFIFPSRMFKNNNNFFKFNANYWNKIFSDEFRSILNFWDTNLELLPDSTKSFLEAKLNLIHQKELNISFYNINNDFEYKIFLQALPDIINLDLISRFLKKHNRSKNDGKSDLKTLFYLYKALFDKYGDYSDLHSFIRFKDELINKILKSLNHSFFIGSYDDYSDQSNLLTFLNKHLNICKTILHTVKDNDYFEHQVPIFIDLLKDEESCEIFTHFFKKKLISQQKNNSYFQFDLLSNDKLDEFVEIAKDQFSQRYPCLFLDQ